MEEKDVKKLEEVLGELNKTIEENIREVCWIWWASFKVIHPVLVKLNNLPQEEKPNFILNNIALYYSIKRAFDDSFLISVRRYLLDSDSTTNSILSALETTLNTLKDVIEPIEECVNILKENGIENILEKFKRQLEEYKNNCKNSDIIVEKIDKFLEVFKEYKGYKYRNKKNNKTNKTISDKNIGNIIEDIKNKANGLIKDLELVIEKLEDKRKSIDRQQSEEMRHSKEKTLELEEKRNKLQKKN